MSTIQELFQQAQLAEAAYANLRDSTGNVIADVIGAKTALKAEGFSESQAAEFVKQWRVVDQSPPLGLFGNGFSATLFERLDASQAPTGQYTLSIAGSVSPIDFANDLLDLNSGGVAYFQVESMINYVLRLQAGSAGTTRQIELLTGATAPSLTSSFVSGVGPGTTPSQLTVTGHSLGGFLGQVYQRIFGSVGVYTYNALGVVRPNAPVFDQLTSLLGLPPGSYSSGPGENLLVPGEPAQLIGTVQGKPQIQVFSETESATINPISTIPAHKMGPLTDSLALYRLFEQIEPTVSIPTLNSILRAMSNTAADSLEQTVGALGKLYNVVTAHVIGDRNGYYTELATLSTALAARPYAFITPLTTQSAADIITQSKTDIAYRYALKELNPFVITGDASLYTAHNATSELDLYDPATGNGNLTDMYLADRAAMLSWLNKTYTEDTDVGRVYDGKAWHFKDQASGKEVWVGNPYDVKNSPRKVLFGQSGADVLTGSGNADHLYGGSGYDTLSGGDGNDYIEGNDGNDILNGDAGRDILIGGAGDDILNGGAGNDALQGGAGADTYKYVTGDGYDFITDSDGVGHIEYNGITLTGGKATDPKSNTYRSTDGKFTYVVSGDLVAGGTLTVSGPSGTLQVNNYKQNDLGIALSAGEPSLSETGPFAGTVTGTEGWDSLAAQGIHAPLHYIALSGNDYIENYIYADWVEGGAGDDVIVTNDTPTASDAGVAIAGNLLEGGDGSDSIGGGAGNDRLFAGTQADLDTVFNSAATAPGAQVDILHGLAGDDIVIGGTGSDVLAGGWGADLIAGGAGDDKLYGNGGTIFRNDSTYYGFVVDDSPERFSDGNNVLYGGAGNDIIMAGVRNDIAYGEEGNDKLFGGAGDDTLYGDVDYAGVVGEQLGDDYLDGGDGNDTLWGDGGNDELRGGAGNDVLHGDVASTVIPHGNDYLDGGDGDDVLIGAGGTDTLFGGAGNDQLYGDADNSAITSQGDDYLDGEDGNDLLIGGGGVDTLFGGAGDDQLDGDAGDLASNLHGNDYLDGGDGNDKLVGNGGADTVFGGAGNDQLFGDADIVALADQGNDYLDGEAGDDYLAGYGGNDTLIGGLGNDALHGDEGNDILDGGEGSDYLSGDAGDDQLDGGAGNDTLLGGEGNDVLMGGAGDDLLSGGDGNDLYTFDAGGGIDEIDDAQGINRVRFAVDFASVSVGQGVGYAGDTYLYIRYGATDTVFIKNGFAGAVQAFEFSGVTLTLNDLLSLSSVPLNLTAATSGGAVSGGAGNDNLVGGAGNDILNGGAGADILSAGGGDDVLQGGVGDDLLSGGSGSDTYVFSLGDGQDVITAREADVAGVDVLAMGPGVLSTDIAYYRLADDSLFARINGTQDSVKFDSWFSQGPNVSLIRFSDGTEVDAATASALAVPYLGGTTSDDQLIGTKFDDHILGYDGNDSLLGGLGNDLLEGGAGADTYGLSRASGTDVLVDTSAEQNTILLGDGLTLSRLRQVRVGNSLRISVGGSESSVLLNDYFVTPQSWGIRDNNGVQTAVVDWLASPRPIVDISTVWAEFIDAVRAQMPKMLVDFRGISYTQTGADTWENWSVTSNASNHFVETLSYVMQTSDASQVRRQSSTTTPTTVSSSEVTRDSTSGTSFSQQQFISLTGFATQLASGASGMFMNGLTPVYGPPELVPGSVSVFQTPLIGFAANVSGPAPYGALAHYYNYASSKAHIVEQIYAGASDNVIYGNGYSVYGTNYAGGSDDITLIDGGAGNDMLYASRDHHLQNNLLYDQDTQVGGLIYGNTGDDNLVGGDYRDVLVGGDGNDVLDGENSADTYVILPGETGTDVIYDSGVPTRTYGNRALVLGIDYTHIENSYYTSLGIPDWQALKQVGTTLPALPAANDFAVLAGLVNSGAIPRDTVAFRGNARPSDLTFTWSQRVQNAPRAVEKSFSLFGEPNQAQSYQSMHAVLNISLADGQVVQIVLPNSSDAIGTGIESFTFDDGTVLSMQDMLQLAGTPPTLDPQNENNLIHGSAFGDAIDGAKGDDVLYGEGGYDNLYGGEGDDQLSAGADGGVLNGGIGSDTYLFAGGDGGVQIEESLSNSGDIDRLLFGEGIVASDLQFSTAFGGNSLLIRIGNTTDQVYILNWFDKSVSGKVEELHFVDGTVMSSAQIDALFNAPPVLNLPIPDQVINEDATLDFALPSGTFSDPNAGDVLTFGAALADGSALPGWLIFDVATQRFSGSPSNADVGAISVKVTATDLAGAAVFDTFDLLVSNSNNAPIIANAISDQTAPENTSFSFIVPANTFADPDIGDVLSYSATLADGTALPSWLTFDAMTQTFSGMPTHSDIGAISVQVTATDPSKLSVSDNFTLTIANLIVGTSGSETLIGTNLADVILGVDGNDIIDGGDGNDVIEGGWGSDMLYGGAGNDTFLVNGFEQAWNWDTFDGGTGVDTILGGASDDTIRVHSLSAANSIERIDGGAGVNVLSGTDGSDLIDLSGIEILNIARIAGGDGVDTIIGTAGNDVIDGGSGDDTLYGGGGTDVLQGGNGNDQITILTGNGLLKGDAGYDNLTGTGGHDLFIGSNDNDTITTGTGYDMIAFNRGDGADIVVASTGADNTLSLGGGIRNQDLAFRKSSKNLILDTGSGESITLQNWYSSIVNRSVLTLQMIEAAASDFAPGGADPLRDNKVEQFNFAGLVTAFDQAIAASPTLTSWALSNALLTFYLGGSDTQAIGGDLAYQYGKTGSLSNIGFTAAQSMLANTQFGQVNQAINQVGLSDGTVRLSA